MTYRLPSRILFTAPLLAVLCACSQAPTQVDDPQSNNSHSTMLLVTRNDGSIVRQSINLDADICLKLTSSPTTTCLTQGEPIVNNYGVVVGYEMRPKTIELDGIN